MARRHLKNRLHQRFQATHCLRNRKHLKLITTVNAVTTQVLAGRTDAGGLTPSNDVTSVQATYTATTTTAGA